MNNQKFKKYLKKIKSLDEWMDNLEELSAIEQDLLKDYIKKLYESVLDIDSGEKVEKKDKKSKKDKTNPEQIIKIEKPVEVDNIPDNTNTEEKTDLVEEKEPTVVQSNEKIEEEIELPVMTFSQDFLELFESSNSSELSHKLSLSPINNLTKAFSINERIFTVKELFANNKTDFEKTINDLDQLHSLDEAKQYILDNIVSKYNWDDSKMIKKVRQFITTVKRRYL